MPFQDFGLFVTETTGEFDAQPEGEGGFFGGIVGSLADLVTPDGGGASGDFGAPSETPTAPVEPDAFGGGLSVATFDFADGVKLTTGGQTILVVGAALVVAWIVLK